MIFVLLFYLSRCTAALNNDSGNSVREVYIYGMESYINNLKEQVEKCRANGNEPAQINVSIQDYQALLEYMFSNQIKMVNQPGFDDTGIESAIPTLYLFELPVVQDVEARNGHPKLS